MSRSDTVARRLRSIPLVFAASVISTLLLPILLGLAAVFDGVRWLRSRTPWIGVRLVPIGWIYLVSEAVGIIGLFLVWVASLGGVIRPVLLSGTYAIQRWWARLLFSSIRNLFDLGLEIEGEEHVATGPFVLFMRHASIIDNLLPNVLVTAAHGVKLKYVLKKELLSDPALDIGGSRLPNYFVDRASADPGAEIAAIRELARDLAADEGVLIYPEGTRFTPPRRARALERLAASDDGLWDRASTLQSVLPPRVGGPLALMDAAPPVDVVIAAHVGLDGFSHIRNVVAGGLVGSTIRVQFRRFPHREIPGERADRVVWLFDRWAEVDEWIRT